jgi:PAS domain-containing protein
MTSSIDPTRSWTRELAHLRTRALKLGLRRPAVESPLADITEEALTACASLLRDLAGSQLECERLRAEIRSEAAAWEHLFEVVPVASVLTDPSGLILNANHAAGVLLNVSAKRLKERQLFLFCEDREAFNGLLQQLAHGEGLLQVSLTMRPRERRPMETGVVVSAVSPGHSTAWLWFFVRPHASETTDGTALAEHGHHLIRPADDRNAAAVSVRSGAPDAPCHRCGASIADGHHFSETDCLNAINREMRALQARTQELSDVRIELTKRQLNQWRDQDQQDRSA